VSGQKAVGKKQKSEGYALTRVRPLTALCLLPTMALLAIGAPLAQFVRIVEIQSSVADTSSPKTYRLLLPAELDELAKNAAKSSDTSKDQKNKAPRLLKPVVDHWEGVSRVEIDSADVPLPVTLVSSEISSHNAVPQFTATLYLTHSPPGPFSTGPPQTL
jgi:hypothetical protein